ncbi:MAG TPA: hypothetical protein VEB68_03420 [Croceibacterium sp.]|nr:hypothetical protein [Croceibacterium sp.]
MTFSIETEWDADRGAEDIDVARITFIAEDEPLTRLIDRETQTNRQYFETSALSLAFFFADNWWRLRHETLGDLRYPSVEWRLRHELSAAAGGSLWPPMMIYGVGERVTLAMAPNYRQAAGPTRYLDFAPIAIDGRDYEAGVDALLERVAHESASHPDGPAFRHLLKQLGSERRDPDVASWRILEACLGFDPDEAPDRVIETMAEFEEKFGEDAVEEAAVAAPGKESPEVLERAIAASEASKIVVDFSELEAIDPWHQMQQGTVPWRLAENAARQLHKRLGRPRNLAGNLFTDLLKIRADDFRRANATARDLPYAAKLADDRRNQLAMQMEPERLRRFEAARMIGDELWSKHARLGVVSRSKSDRQKFQRAFAKALLAPFAELRRRIDLDRPDSKQIIAAADYFDVDKTVVRASLIDKGYLAAPSFEDMLENA